MAAGLEGIRIAICDDCKEDREFFKEALREYTNGQMNLFSVDEFECGEALLSADTDVYTLIFMDIFMKGMNGMETAKELRSKGTKAMLVFVSSSKEFAVESYQVEALHYIIKDYDKSVLHQVLDKFFRNYPMDRSIEVKVGRERRMVRLQDILYVEASNKKCILHTVKEDLEVSLSMSELAGMLPSAEFVRPIRYAIVSLKEVVAVPTDVMKLSNGVEIPIGRGERQVMKKAFAEYRWMMSKM